ncbi:hypothetical protein K1719_005589 [Acacia pycnantha]|nr:hypothetical protein K1719_005589 [Acacia pycnantha]
MKFMKLGSKPDTFQTVENNVRFVASDLASDIIATVGDTKFYLHKFPLLSKSAQLQKLISTNNLETEDEVQISEIPVGAFAFEICAKFCYGMTVTLNAYNVMPARCAAEYLGMHKTTEKGNLIYKIDVFLSSIIFHSRKGFYHCSSATSNPLLLPLAEDFKIVSHCIKSISSKVCVDVSKVDWSYSYNRMKLPQENCIDPNQTEGSSRTRCLPKDWWVEDLCELEVDSYMSIMSNIINKKVVSSQVIGEALKAYAN